MATLPPLIATAAALRILWLGFGAIFYAINTYHWNERATQKSASAHDLSWERSEDPDLGIFATSSLRTSGGDLTKGKVSSRVGKS